MSEAILKAMMQLFALIVDIDEIQEISEKERAIIRAFLSRQLNSELTEKYMAIFENYLQHYHHDTIDKQSVKRKKRRSLTAVRILSICEQINEELEQRQKIYVIFQLVEYIAYGIEIHETELEFLQTVAAAFNLDEEGYQQILHFVIYPLKEMPVKEAVLLISNGHEADVKGVHHIHNHNLEGLIYFLNVTSVNTYILRYQGKEDLFLNGQLINPGITYTFDHGSSIRGQKIDPIYYTDVAEVFSVASFSSRITFVARDVEFRFKNSSNGIQGFNLSEESGRLIGIMGGSGVGKSTLLNVLNGNLEPQQGEILINGYNLYHEKEREQLNGVLGFIPQDDLLLEELTVRQNLYYNAKLCLDNTDEARLNEVVDQVLHDLDLYDIRNFKVGKPLNKVISGGQRKRVNIGLELIREPSILFVDEPTSGLSSVDSEMVMNLLREQVFNGRLVLVNIHQPSSTLYKMFDRIIFMDKGGYQIYCGNPSEAVVYFKTKSNHANATEDQCIRCGNVDPDQVLQIIEAKIVNEHGKLSRTRKVSPKEWSDLYTGSNGRSHQDRPGKEKLPDNQYRIPGLLKQIKIFFTRDILSKFTNKQYILITLLEAPLLAVIMGYFTKYFSGTSDNPAIYVFRNNENLPAFLLMSVVVFLFLGLTISSEEIIKDRKIIQRESFLNLSRGSYLHSKILIMFAISAFQTLSYVLIGNLIFEIKGMLFSYWLILFTTSCFANLLGLNISAGLNSVITIYILVPFLLIPQILFSGVLVKYDKLHKSLTNYEQVPVIGDMMTSRWAYEALAVEQFKNNRYQKEYFDIDQEISSADYLQAYLVPELKIKLDELKQSFIAGTDHKTILAGMETLRNQLAELGKLIPELPPYEPGQPDVEPFCDSTFVSIQTYLDRVTDLSRNRVGKAKKEKDVIDKVLIEQLGGLKAYTTFRNRYDNKSLSNLLLNRHVLDKVVEKDGRLIRKHQPAYMKPTSRIGRAHLYAPNKQIGNLEIDTMWYNVIAIWIYSLFLYLALYHDLLRKLISFSETRRLIRKGTT
ncbi:MAG: ATP-binding cassette domain-containing protein [Bacteroidales bacterium]|nr:ATP-binding cassette domain-containing protein [Bacteroidales bacterium]